LVGVSDAVLVGTKKPKQFFEKSSIKNEQKMNEWGKVSRGKINSTPILIL
jgi:hypothetical protein